MGVTYPMHAPQQQQQQQQPGRSPKNGHSTARGFPAGAPSGAKHHNQHHDIFGAHTAAFHAHTKPGASPHHHASSVTHHPQQQVHQVHPGGLSAAQGTPPPQQQLSHAPQQLRGMPSHSHHPHHGGASPHGGTPPPKGDRSPPPQQQQPPQQPQTVLKVAEFRSGGRPLPALLTAITGAASEQGKRPTMEDVHAAHQGLMDKVSLYFVCDGHSGRATADMAEQLLPQLLRDIPMKDLHSKTAQSLAEWFVKVDRAIFKNMRRLRTREGGAAAVAAVTIGNELFIANLGDSRAVLCDGGHAIALTKDHKPTDQAEAQRVMQSGGIIALGRVGGSLAITRAFGDFELKGRDKVLESTSLPVSNVPDISHISLTTTCEFLILACDGVWDVLKCQDAVSICREHISKGPTKMAQALARASLEHGSMDNITVLVIMFSQCDDTAYGHGIDRDRDGRGAYHGRSPHATRSPPPAAHAPASATPNKRRPSNQPHNQQQGGASHNTHNPHHLNPSRTNVRVTPGQQQQQQQGGMAHTTPAGGAHAPTAYGSRYPGVPF
eukprot:TRINITY_DN1812_c0_g2_i1.p1 TRINITY_DN1812_c0_g2~~TRINITY_DN1812_c0_g2_i1.p1  ORF type:complete len:594 (+),score=182.66 TRINITY_DN1812_c0_g2_i1:133-1782(+)